MKLTNLLIGAFLATLAIVAAIPLLVWGFVAKEVPKWLKVAVGVASAGFVLFIGIPVYALIWVSCLGIAQGLSESAWWLFGGAFAFVTLVLLGSACFLTPGINGWRRKIEEILSRNW